jgi:hypothetical protein
VSGPSALLVDRKMLRKKREIFASETAHWLRRGRRRETRRPLKRAESSHGRSGSCKCSYARPNCRSRRRHRAIIRPYAPLHWRTDGSPSAGRACWQDRWQPQRQRS